MTHYVVEFCFRRTDDSGGSAGVADSFASLEDAEAAVARNRRGGSLAAWRITRVERETVVLGGDYAAGRDDQPGR